MQGINWTQSLLAALISIVVTVVGGYILYKIQFENPELSYQIDNALPFIDKNKNMSIYHVKFENRGNKLAEDIITQVSIRPAKIINMSITSDSPIEWKTEQDSSHITIKTNSLNPHESFKLSFIATNNDSLPKQPVVKLRAKGIVGEKVELSSKKSLSELRIFPLIMSVFAIITTLFTRAIISAKEIGSQHSDDQDKIMSYLFGIHKLDDQVDRILSLPNKPSYWAESDRLTSLSINSNDITRIIKTKDLLKDLLEYAILADSSKGIIYFNLAKIEKILNNTNQSEYYITEAKKLIPKLVVTRLKLDPVLP